MPPGPRSSTRPSSAAVPSSSGHGWPWIRAATHCTGTTSSAEFPTTAGAFDRERERCLRCVRHPVERRRARRSSTRPSWEDSGFDSGSGLHVDAAGNAYVSGGAGSIDFPVTPGAFDTLPDGSSAFVSQVESCRFGAHLFDRPRRHRRRRRERDRGGRGGQRVGDGNHQLR